MNELFENLPNSNYSNCLGLLGSLTPYLKKKKKKENLWPLEPVSKEKPINGGFYFVPH